LGTEVVQGRVINTNAAFIGRRLTLLGFNVIGAVSLVDDVDIIARHLSYVLGENPRVVVTTGGLGPTYDDRTLEAVAKAINRELVPNEEALAMIKKKYESLGLPLTNERIKMGYMPRGAKPIPNPVGTAPGCWIELGETIIISLPGVPKEMEAMWSSWVEPRLREIGPGYHIAEKVLVVRGIPESTMAPVIKSVLRVYPEVYIKSHPFVDPSGKPLLEIYIMYSHRDDQIASKVVEDIIKGIRDKYKELYGTELRIEEIRDQVQTPT